MQLYNTMSRKKEQLKLSKNVKIYFCGPTVYDFAHIGNFRAYIFSDLLRRYIEYLGCKVKLVMNITDVDDKTIKNSREQGVSLSEFTDKYAAAFFDDARAMRIDPASA